MQSFKSFFKENAKPYRFGPPRRNGIAKIRNKKPDPTLVAYCRSVTRNDMDLEGCIVIGTDYGIDAAKNVF